MSQLDLHTTNPNSLCASCVHRTQKASYCRRFVRSLQDQRVLTCNGHTTDRQREDRQSGAIGAAALVLIGLLAMSCYVPSAAGAGLGGYPAPWTDTPTAPPYVWPTCHPNCPTNTPVPPYGWGATATAGAEVIAATPSPMSAISTHPYRLYVPMVARRVAP